MFPKKTSWASSSIYNHIYTIILYYLITYLVPLSMLVYFTVILSINLRKMNEKRQEMSNKVKERSDPLRRLLYVIYGPYHIGCGTVYFYFGSVSVMLVNFNSACNFFIFCLCSPGFRRKLNQMFSRSGRVEPIGLSATVNNSDGISTINEIQN